MGMRLASAQIDKLQHSVVGVLNFSASGSSGTVTTPITTALSTAGDNSASVPLQVSTTTAPGVVVTPPNNHVRIARTSDKMPLADASNNQVYGRITHSAGTYTLSYFTLVNGTETAHSFGTTTNIDFYFPYQFDFATFPRNAGTGLSGVLVQDDPQIIASTGSTVRPPEVLTVTALNTLSALSTAPSGAGRIILYVNGKAEFATGGSPAFSVSGTTVTWSQANAGYALATSGYEVYALIW